MATAKKVVSPLHRAIDALRWDAERLLSRLLLLVHAAFLEVGFVLVQHGAPEHRTSDEGFQQHVGGAASDLPFRYTAPRLLHRAEAAALRVHARGSCVVFYIRFDPPRLSSPDDAYCAGVDGLAVAPLLSRGLDETARALRGVHGPLGKLWAALSEGMCRHALVDLCRRSGVALGDPAVSLMSLPGEIKAAILARLDDARDLPRVEYTCAGLRRVVAEHDRELWRPRYEALLAAAPPLPPPAVADSPETETTTWKERYVTEWQRPASMSRLRAMLLEEADLLQDAWSCAVDDEPPSDDWLTRWVVNHFFSARPEPLLDHLRQLRKPRAQPDGGGNVRGRRGGGAIHSPSSRYRWKHR